MEEDSSNSTALIFIAVRVARMGNLRRLDFKGTLGNDAVSPFAKGRLPIFSGGRTKNRIRFDGLREGDRWEIAAVRLKLCAQGLLLRWTDIFGEKRRDEVVTKGRYDRDK